MYVCMYSFQEFVRWRFNKHDKGHLERTHIVKNTVSAFFKNSIFIKNFDLKNFKSHRKMMARRFRAMLILAMKFKSFFFSTQCNVITLLSCDYN